jgi:hypothetical protein
VADLVERWGERGGDAAMLALLARVAGLDAAPAGAAAP